MVCFKFRKDNVIQQMHKGLKDMQVRKKGNQVYIEVYKPNDFEAIAESRVSEKRQNSDSLTGIILQNSSSQDLTKRNSDVSKEKELSSKIEDYKQIISKYKKTMQAMDKKNQENEEELKKYIEQVVTHNLEIQKCKDEVKEAKHKVKEYEREHIAMTKQVELMKISLDKKEQRIIELHIQTSKGEDTITEKTAQITALQEQLKQVNETFEKLQISINDLSRMYQSKSQENVELLATVNQFKYANEELKSSNSIFQGRYEGVKEQIDGYLNKISILNGVIEEKNKTIEELKNMFPE